jgi:hypothetical protein
MDVCSQEKKLSDVGAVMESPPQAFMATFTQNHSLLGTLHGHQIFLHCCHYF